MFGRERRKRILHMQMYVFWDPDSWGVLCGGYVEAVEAGGRGEGVAEFEEPDPFSTPSVT
jgi:hypothetical protein